MSCGVRDSRSDPSAYHRPENSERANARQPGQPRIAVLVGERRRTCEDGKRDEGEPPNPDQRGSLCKLDGPRERIAEGIPGKAGEHVPTQPFGGSERNRECDDARGPRVHKSRAPAKPSAVKIARHAGTPVTAIGSNQANVSASTRNA